MSLRQEIETWVTALQHYDHHDYDAALQAFHRIADTSKIWFNCGIIHATLGEHGKAIDCYQRATQLDQYLAISYFQQGVSNFLTRGFEEALANFNDALLYLRGNRCIDYSQLGLEFKLHSCEVLFNRGLCYISLQQHEVGMSDLFFASKEKAVPDHSVIDEAIRDRADGYTVFSIPVGKVYRPNEAKVRNLQTKDYLGRARLVAQQRSNRDERRHFSAQNLSSGIESEGVGSYAAMHLVRPGLPSRGRQCSEPPLNRAVLSPEMARPDTDDDTREGTHQSRHDLPERQSHHRQISDTPVSSTTSVRRNPTRPDRLGLGVAAFDYPSAGPPLPNTSTGNTTITSPNFSKPSRSTASPRCMSDRPLAIRTKPSTTIDTSFKERQYNPEVASQSCERLSAFDPARHGPTSTPSSPEQHAPVARSHARSQSRSTVTSHGRARSGSWSETPRGRGSRRVESIMETTEPGATASAADASTRTLSDAFNTESSRQSDSPASATSSLGGFELVTHASTGTGNSSAAAVQAATNLLKHKQMSGQFRRPSRGPSDWSRARAGSVKSLQPPGNSSNHALTAQDEVVNDPPSPPSLKQLRLKLHGEHDTRYLMVAPDTTLSTLLELVRAKLRIDVGCKCKVKMRDEEGDAITIADEEDWAMCLEMARTLARREWDAAIRGGKDGRTVGELGKVDLWVSAV